MTTIIEVAYEGSTAVRIDGRLYNYSPQQARGGVLPRVARKLIKEGADPDCVVRVTRGGIKVFASDSTLREWAGITYEEPDNAKRGIRKRAYRPHSSERADSISGGRMPPEQAQAPALLLSHY